MNSGVNIRFVKTALFVESWGTLNDDVWLYGLMMLQQSVGCVS